MAFTDFNADGEPAVEPTCDQKYIFDVKGWIAFPGVLADDDIEEMREFCLKLKTEPESVPEPEQVPPPDKSPRPPSAQPLPR